MQGKRTFWRAVALATVAMTTAISALGNGSAGAAGSPHVFDTATFGPDTQIGDLRTPLIGNFALNDFDDLFYWSPGGSGDDLLLSSLDRDGFFGFDFGQQVGGRYQPFIGNFGGDGHTDIFWYAPGKAADSLWISNGDGTFTKHGVTVNGTYRPVVGNFDGTGRDEILWYAPGSGADSVWTLTGPGAAHTSKSVTLNGNYVPLVADVSDGADGHHGQDIVWQQTGVGNADYLWVPTGAGFASQKLHLRAAGDPSNPDAVSEIIVGSFGGDAHDDLFSYGPGRLADRVALGSANGLVSGPAVVVNGLYTPRAGDWNGDDHDDILWASKAGGPNQVWDGTDSGTGAFDKVAGPVTFPDPGAQETLYRGYVGDTLGTRRFDFITGPDPSVPCPTCPLFPAATDDVMGTVLATDLHTTTTFFQFGVEPI